MISQPVNRKIVERLIREFGSDTLSYFHLQHDRQYFFSPSGKSCLSYKIVKNVAVVGGDPVGVATEVPLLLETFLSYTASWHILPLFVGLSEKYASVVQKTNMKLAKIGEEAIIDVQTFDVNNLKKKVRRAVRHAEGSGVEICFFTTTTLPFRLRQQIEEISFDWIKEKGGKEKGFSMTLKRLPEENDRDCIFAVALKDGDVLGYLYFVPCYGANSVSLDHIRSKTNTYNGLHEFLIIKSAEYFKKNNIQKMSLNFATFANVIQTSKSKLHIRRRVMLLLMKLYKCDTLRSFNNKFKPFWENRYVAYSSLLYLPNYLFAVIEAER